ncbi:hypothetical protein D3C85_756890 [compost metagenome]
MNFIRASVLILCAGLVAMHVANNPTPETLSERIGADIWIDPETKCQYFLHDGVGGARQPRLNREGKPYCG